MKEDYQMVFDRNRSQLIAQIDIDSVIPNLLSKAVITGEHKSKIQVSNNV